MDEIKERHWVSKFKSGEFLRDWEGYDTILIGGPYSENLDIGEKKFSHCMDFFCGIGDVDWWIKDELEKLSEEDKEELRWICKYKTYLKETISYDLVNKVADFYGCKSHHIHRTGKKGIIDLCEDLSKFYDKILKNSTGDRDEVWNEYRENGNPFKIMSFMEYKLQPLKKEMEDFVEGLTPKVEPPLNVIGFQMYKDGGTILMETNEGDIFIDRRLKTITYGKFFTEYPEKDDITHIVEWEEEEKLRPRLIEGLKNYETNEHYSITIKKLIKDLGDD